MTLEQFAEEYPDEYDDYVDDMALLAYFDEIQELPEDWST